MSTGKNIVNEISSSGLTIYSSLQDRPHLFIPNDVLEILLSEGLKGLVLNQPLRTRSKVLKSRVCSILGYPVPKSFKKIQPRFPGQNFDTYVQKSNNLQIWNEEVSASRRYVIIRVNEKDIVTKVRVVTGDIIAAYDTTGTLTHKYQAKAKTLPTKSHLNSFTDTANVTEKLITALPPTWPNFLVIEQLYKELLKLIGTTITDPGITQERNRGGSLHEAVCSILGNLLWHDDGQFPDIKEQLLEIKLQTSPTIDLGLVCPDSPEPIDDLPMFRHNDVRYTIFYGSRVPLGVQLNHLVLSTGADFFNYFRLFGGLGKNKKYQIPLPGDFFT
jgi:hypothetical protein